MKKISYLILILLGMNNLSLATTIPLDKKDINYQQRIEWFKRLKWDQGCENDFRDTQHNNGGLTFWPLAKKKYLIEVNCINGPYQGAYIYLYYDANTKQNIPLQFKTFVENDNGKIKATMTPNISQAYSEGMTPREHFNIHTKELTVITKYRGLNDCGHKAVYSIKDGIAELKRFEAKFECDGKSLHYKTYFPVNLHTARNEHYGK